MEGKQKDFRNLGPKWGFYVVGNLSGRALACADQGSGFDPYYHQHPQTTKGKKVGGLVVATKVIGSVTASEDLTFHEELRFGSVQFLFVM